jgi:hypothetical protein
MRFEEFSDRELRAERARRCRLLDLGMNGSTAEIERQVKRIADELDRRALLRRPAIVAALKAEIEAVRSPQRAREGTP